MLTEGCFPEKLGWARAFLIDFAVKILIGGKPGPAPAHRLLKLRFAAVFAQLFASQFSITNAGDRKSR